MRHKKSILSTIEKFGIISSFVFSFIALLFSIGEFIYENIIENIEKVLIINEYESDYFFDGNVLSKNISIVISNNSKNSISLIEVDIEREDKHYIFESVKNDVCPINMEPNETITKDIPIEFNIEDEAKQFKLRKYGKNCTIKYI